MAYRPIIAVFLSLSISVWGLAAAEPPEDASVAAEKVSHPPVGDGSKRVDSFESAIRRAEDDLAKRGTKAQDATEGWSIGDVLSVMALVAALLLMWRVMRWTRGGGVFRAPGGREMSVLDRLAVGRQTTLLVIRLRGRDYWLADHPQGVTLLAENILPADWSSPSEKPAVHDEPEDDPGK